MTLAWRLSTSLWRTPPGDSCVKGVDSRRRQWRWPSPSAGPQSRWRSLPSGHLALPEPLQSRRTEAPLNLGSEHDRNRSGRRPRAGRHVSRRPRPSDTRGLRAAGRMICSVDGPTTPSVMVHQHPSNPRATAGVGRLRRLDGSIRPCPCPSPGEVGPCRCHYASVGLNQLGAR